ncbi:LLM class flavin-dependent oxidoreductase [Salinarchaeum laminariae]|uniref:LLM class flavin-dependent oxidoreductase n=1 Tax=Salinarchaeum laminariae TaxID=869888 RepID=UPI0020C1601B|nr:LLM class flavin-dependent oxidoreductase [Salinarchaeum laminariae]
MTKFGWFASLEEFSPQECLDQVDIAYANGFDSITVNDHFHPWFHTKAGGEPANCGNCWSWMPIALDRTEDMEIGTGVSALLRRYHPANVAHRLATLEELYPDRVFLGVGTGEALNESPLGNPLPDYGERAKRTAEAIRLIRRLFEEEFVTFDGTYYQTDEANLYTGPDEAPPIHIAASGPTAARMAGDLGDGLITVYEDPEFIHDTIFAQLENGVQKSERNESFDDVEKTIHIHVSLDDEYDAALEPALPWRGTLVDRFYTDDVADPRVIQQAGEDEVSEEALTDAYIVTDDPQDIIDVTETYVDCGFEHIVYQSHSPDQERFAEFVADDVMPSF